MPDKRDKMENYEKAKAKIFMGFRVKQKAWNSLFILKCTGEPMNIKETVYLLRKEQFFIFNLIPSLSVGPNKIQ